MDADHIRKLFFSFFKQHGHKVIRSSSLIPANDPTLLFTNAGMNQFKDYFLGNAVPKYRRAVTCQKVMRAGGKHNDLENVGKTPRHHTFFEMLGNFSFGDYFKEDAIQFAWQFLTETLGISPDKLAVSVFKEDDAAFEIWHKKIGLPPDRIARLGAEENFWTMGDTGPCGPCSEIHYDLYGDNGKTPAKSLAEDDGRFLEIWNLVFMQYERKSNGETVELPNPSIDTGMGLERITSVLANVKSNYDTSLFKPLLKTIAERGQYRYGTDEAKDVSCKVIADHVRALTFLIADGLIPGNEGRGYVMRRILRRAARHAKHLDENDGFLSDTVPAVVAVMEKAYPEMLDARDYIQKIILTEEKRFSGTLTHGLKYLDKLIENAVSKNQKTVSGNDVFKLYDTYGFPADLANTVLEDHGLTYNSNDYDRELSIQKNKARDAQLGLRKNKQILPVYQNLQSKYPNLQFSGYDANEAVSDAVCLIVDGKESRSIDAQNEFELILSDTPFYAEGGGQIGDRGYMENEHVKLRVLDTFKPFPGLHVSKVKVVHGNAGHIDIGELKKLRATIDSDVRHDIEVHHTAAHLLHNGLRHILGHHVKQAGSMVDNHRLRFDFSHYEPLNPETIKLIEEYVNELVRKNYPVSIKERSIDEALDKGALAFFGDKYGDTVRVVSAGPSVELCGGCHVKQTAELAFVKIVSEESVASGVRRIEAYAGNRVGSYILENLEFLRQSSRLLGIKPSQLSRKISELEASLKTTQQQNKTLKIQLFRNDVDSGKYTERHEHMELTCRQANSKDDLNEWGLQLLKQKPVKHIGILYAVDANKISLVLTVSNDVNTRNPAGALIKKLSVHIDAKGGGKNAIGRCGGTKPSGLGAFLNALKQCISDIK